MLIRLLNKKHSKFRIKKYVKNTLLISFFVCTFSAKLSAAENIKIASQLLAPPLAAHSGQKIITLDYLLNLPDNFESSTVHWIDKFHLLYCIPQNNNKKFQEVGVIDIKTKHKTQLDDGLMPKPSPDGKWIAYIHEINGKKQLWIMQTDGKAKKQITEIPHGLTGGAGYHYDFAWSPSSAQLAFFYQPEVEDWNRVKKTTSNENKTSAISDENLLEPLPKTNVSVIDIVNTSIKSLANVDAKLRYISWFPDGKNLLFLEEREARRYNQKNDETWIKMMKVSDGKEHTITEIKGLQQSLQPIASPDGKKIAFTYDSTNSFFSVLPNVGIVSTKSDSSSIKKLTHELKLFSPHWSPDGKSIYVRRNYGAYNQIYVVDVETGTAKQITNAPLNIESYDLSSDGTLLAWIGKDAHANTILRVATTDGKNISDLVTFPTVSKEFALSEVREIAWSSPTCNVPMRGILILPLHYQEGKRYPLITDIHGGDIGASIYLTGGILVYTPLEWQLWAAKGYAVFVPEFRSSGAFGSLAITRDEMKEHDLVNKDMQDVISGIDILIAKGIVDRNRTAVIGHSAGGRRVNWLAVTTHRFKALVSKEGWVDEWISSGIDPMKRVTMMYGGEPVKVPENYQKNSALFHAKGATTPILFLMSSPEKGADSQLLVRWLYHAIKDQGVETHYVQYPDEGHVLERRANRKDAFERIIQWIDGHM